MVVAVVPLRVETVLEGQMRLGRATLCCATSCVALRACFGAPPPIWLWFCCGPCLLATLLSCRRGFAFIVLLSALPPRTSALALCQRLCMSLLHSTASPLLFSTSVTAPLIASPDPLPGTIRSLSLSRARSKLSCPFGSTWRRGLTSSTSCPTLVGRRSFAIALVVTFATLAS